MQRATHRVLRLTDLHTNSSLRIRIDYRVRSLLAFRVRARSASAFLLAECAVRNCDGLRKPNIFHSGKNSESLPDSIVEQPGSQPHRDIAHLCNIVIVRAAATLFFRVPFVLVMRYQKHAGMKFLSRSSLPRKRTSILISSRVFDSLFFRYANSDVGTRPPRRRAVC